MRLLALATILGLGIALSGCASIDASLFGKPGPGAIAASEPATVPDTQPPAVTGGASSAPAAPGETAPAPEQTASQPAPGALPPVAPEAAAEAEATPQAPEPGPSEEQSAPVAPHETASASKETPSQPMPGTLPPIASGGAPTPPPLPPAETKPVAVAAAADTGTAVGRTAATIRGDLQNIASAVAASSHKVAQQRSSIAGEIGNYQRARAEIATQLQIGTTPANPQLVAQWNTARAALDRLTANVSALNGLNAEIGGESSRAQSALKQIEAASGSAGAVDEDRRQLALLKAEADQTAAAAAGLQRQVSADFQRQTASLTGERANLKELQAAIARGSSYSGAAIPAAAPAPEGAVGAPLIVIRFDRADYQKALYEALSEALKTRPTASFDVIGVSPAGDTAAAIKASQASARRRAQNVLKTMVSMGVPAARMNISSQTDPAIAKSEVRVFLR